MTTAMLPNPTEQPLVEPRWGAIFAMSLGAFVLIASEFMPVSLLTPIATDLNISEGHAGQGIAVSGVFALITSLFMSSLAGHLDRKVLLLLLTVLMIVSGSIVASSPNYATFMIGRALIGVAIGGFWSMSAATAMRLVPHHQVPRALAIINGGNALATIIAAPLGSFLGSIIGWRGAFFCVVPITVIALIGLLISLPAMKANPHTVSKSLFKLLTRFSVTSGMFAVALFFVGQFALFTYLRPFLETVTHVDVSTLSLILLVMGVAGLAGTIFIGLFLKTNLFRVLIFIPVLMAIIALALTKFGNSMVITTILLGMWGFIGTAAPVAWWTWLSRTLPDDAETGGGLMVATIQLAITVGATLGGIVFDLQDYRATFELSAAILLIAAILAFVVSRTSEMSAQKEHINNNGLS